MPTTTGLTLNEWLAKSMGDWLRVKVTTNIAADNKIISTTLNEYDNDRDDTFQDWYTYIEDKQNETKERKVKKYYTANAALNCYGANFTADASNASNVWLGRYRYSDRERALNDAGREVYPLLHKWVVDRSLATNQDLIEYPLPSSFDNGDVYSVAVNVVLANAATEWQKMYRYDPSWSIVNEGHTLRLSEFSTSGYEIKIEGIAPIENMTASTAVNIAGPQVDLLVAYAKYKMYQGKAGPLSSVDIAKSKQESAEAYGEYKRLLPKARMLMPSRPLQVRRIGG